MKVIIDTNVFISAIFFKGVPSQILQYWQNNHFEWIISTEIFEEYQRVANIFHERYPTIDLNPILQHVLLKSSLICAPNFSQPICEDPDDDKFLACALAAQANFIVSGDKHLLKLHPFENIPILKPRQFLDFLLKDK